MDKFNAIADPNRRRIIELIAVWGQVPVAEISREFDISPPTISQHLSVLRDAGLVSMTKNRQKHIYRLNHQGMSEILTWLTEVQNFGKKQKAAIDNWLA